ncbi:beta-galactosidase, partial [Myxococcota bacterium]|nr:beta-galactosidase [Myxococcota bacterium]
MFRVFRVFRGKNLLFLLLLFLLLPWFLTACDDASPRPVDESDAAGWQNHTPPDDAGVCPDGCTANNFTAPAFSGIEIRPEGFVLDGDYRTLRGGTLQWFRLPRGEWDDRLRKFASAGFNTVDVYVPWNVVEPEPGLFDFTDLLAFLSACRAHGLYVYFRP